MERFQVFQVSSLPLLDVFKRFGVHVSIVAHFAAINLKFALVRVTFHLFVVRSEFYFLFLSVFAVQYPSNALLSTISLDHRTLVSFRSISGCFASQSELILDSD